MATTTTPANPHSHHHPTSHSRTHSGAIPSRPTTPLRPPSRSSLRASQSTPSGSLASSKPGDHPLSALEPAFSELSDSMADLEANMMHLQLLNDSLSRFSENFAAFLYGMNMTAFCVDFPEAPLRESYARHKHTQGRDQMEDSPFRAYEGQGYEGGGRAREGDVEATFMTSDTSGFVEHPEPSTLKKSAGTTKFSEVPGSLSTPGKFAGRGRAGAGTGRGGFGTRGTVAAARGRGSGIARGSSTARGSTRGTGIARGVARGRGVR